MRIHKTTNDIEQMRLLFRRSTCHFAGATHALKILKLIDRDASACEIEEEAKKSPTTATSIIKLASTAAFAGTRIKSVRFAIELLGYNEISRLMTTIAMSSINYNGSRCSNFNQENFRIRAVMTALIGESLATKTGEPVPARHYMTCLFLDIAYVFLAIQQPTLIQKIELTAHHTPGATVEELDKSCLGFSHAELSAVIAEELNLPEQTVSGIRFHTDPIYCPVEHLTYGDIACVASSISDSIGLESIAGVRNHEIDALACKRLGINPEDIARLAIGSGEKSDLMINALSACA